ncbi:MAG: hypothetical protein ABEK16_06305 [Candidatus Nanohalobium sp.]
MFLEHKERDDSGNLREAKPPEQPDDLQLVGIPDNELPEGWRDAMHDRHLKLRDIGDPSSLVIEDE